MELVNFISLLVFLLLALLFGCIIIFVSRRCKSEGNPVVEEINEILPQTQCGQCSYPGCKPYAEAIARGDAQINQCPPGGEDVIKKLAQLLDMEVLTLNPDNGTEKEKDTVVEIIEEECIGCTKCIQVCPVDAIVGAAKKMHTVIAVECTGCDLCIPACPVDCIVVVDAPLPASIHRLTHPQLLNTVSEAQQW